MSGWEEKAWGRTRTVIHTDLYSRHELEVVAGGYCSVHWHEHRANRFLVLEGAVLVIELYGWHERPTLLTADNVLEVSSLVPHQFQVIESGRIIEEYWPDRGGRVDLGDIVRLTRGGLDLEQVKQGKGIIR